LVVSPLIYVACRIPWLLPRYALIHSSPYLLFGHKDCCRSYQPLSPLDDWIINALPPLQGLRFGIETKSIVLDTSRIPILTEKEEPNPHPHSRPEFLDPYSSCLCGIRRAFKSGGVDRVLYQWLLIMFFYPFSSMNPGDVGGMGI